MSIYQHLRQISSQAIEAARRNPDLAGALLFVGYPEWVLQEPAESDTSDKAIIERSRAFDAKKHASRMAAFLAGAGLSDIDLGPECNLDRTWEELAQVLDALAFDGSSNLLRSGGEELGEDTGYGPARFFSATEIAGIHDSVASLDRKRVEATITEHAQAYGDQSQGEAVEWLNQTFQKLAHALGDAHERGMGLVVWLA